MSRISILSARHGRVRYGLVFSLVLLALVAGMSALLLSGRAPRHEVAAGENAGGLPATDPSSINPRLDDYARYAIGDSLWRRGAAPAVRPEDLVTPPWAPSPRDTVMGNVQQLYQARLLDQAIDQLDRWVTNHPGDRAEELELARLLAQAGRYPEADAHYQALLGSNRDRATAIEYAGVLLLAGRNDDAAREFQALVVRDSADAEARLGLARAWYWAGHPREAEKELAWLRHEPGYASDTAVGSLIESVREAFEPTADEAERWVAEGPDHGPYRLALARALAREQRWAAAVAHYDTLIARDPSVSLYREAAWTHQQCGDAAGAVKLLQAGIAMAPRDETLRRELAETLVGADDLKGAIQQYTVLLASPVNSRPDPALLVRRGQLRAWSGDLDHSAEDLTAAIAVTPTLEALALLGDVERWRGDLSSARDAYQAALKMDSLHAGSREGLLAVKEQERLALASYPARNGWASTASEVSDNSGYFLEGLSLDRSISVRPRTAVLASLESRRVGLVDASGLPLHYTGYHFSAGAEWYTGWFKARGRVGLAHYPAVRDAILGSVSANAFWSRVQISLDWSTGPAYAELMAPRTFFGKAETDWGSSRPLLIHTVSTGVNVLIGSASVWASIEHFSLSDHNVATGVHSSLRVPLSPYMTLAYDGSLLTYQRRSLVYWDPVFYTSHSIGAEVSAHMGRHAGFTFRAQPGFASTLEDLRGGDPSDRVSSQISQFLASSQVWYRRNRWELGTNLFYNRGRQFGYRAYGGDLTLRLGW